MHLPHRHRRNAEIFYVMAVANEYGPELRARISPLLTGVGPVEAAIGVTRALGEFAAGDRLPRLVVTLGSAGSRTLPQLEVFQASSISYRDMDASPLGFEPGVTPFLGLPRVLTTDFTIPGIRTARLSTGANVVSGEAYDRIDADMVDMETYAVLRACQTFDVPLVALRGISDGADELRTIDDWTRYLPLIDERLAEAVDRLEQAVADGTLTPV